MTSIYINPMRVNARYHWKETFHNHLRFADLRGQYVAVNQKRITRSEEQSSQMKTHEASGNLALIVFKKVTSLIDGNGNPGKASSRLVTSKPLFNSDDFTNCEQLIVGVNKFKGFSAAQ